MLAEDQQFDSTYDMDRIDNYGGGEYVYGALQCD